jgi:hypothetical protein
MLNTGRINGNGDMVILQLLITLSYLRRTKVLHPDRFDQDARPQEWQEANEMLKELNDAYGRAKAELEQPTSNIATPSYASTNAADEEVPPSEPMPNTAFSETAHWMAAPTLIDRIYAVAVYTFRVLRAIVVVFVVVAVALVALLAMISQTNSKTRD